MKLRLIAFGTALASAAALTSAPASASSVLLDLTKSGVVADGNSNSPVGPIATGLAGISVTITSSANPITNTVFDGGASTGCIAQGGPLACDRDGLGIIDDEVSEPGTAQSLTFTFSDRVRFEEFHFLDLFRSPNGQTGEIAEISIDGAVALTLSATSANASNGGYGLLDVGSIVGQMFRFTVSGSPNNDGSGVADAAFAAVGISAVPLPAAAWMLIAALGGLGMVSRGRRTA